MYWWDRVDERVISKSDRNITKGTSIESNTNRASR